MAKKLKLKLITVFGAIAIICLCIFAGCKFSYTVDEIKERYNLTAQVTYFINGDAATFNDNSKVKNLYYASGSKPMNIGVDSLVSGSSAMKLSTGYNFSGWYYVETDTDGAPLYSDGIKKYVEGEEYDYSLGMKVGEAADFTKLLQDGDHIYVCGEFYEDVKLRFKLLCAEDKFDMNYSVKNGNEEKEVTVTEGNLIEGHEFNIPKNGLSVILPREIAISGYTVIGLYSDAEGTASFNSWPIRYPEPNEEGKYDDFVLYAKVLEGKWTTVSTPNEFALIFGDYSGTQFYITQDIDCGGLQTGTLYSFSGAVRGAKLAGGGTVTVSNFNARNAEGLTSYSSASLFGEITNTAVIKNVTFDNFSVEFSVRNNADPNVCLFSYRIADGAKFENFTMSNGQLKLSQQARTTNATNWLFRDATKPEGVTITSCSCLNGSEVYTTN